MKKINRKLFIGVSMAVLVITIVLVNVAVVFADNPVLYKFSPGTSISSSQVNGNFSALANAMPAVGRGENDASGLSLSGTSPAEADRIIVNAPAAGYIIVYASGFIGGMTTTNNRYDIDLKISNTPLDLSVGQGTAHYQWPSGIATINIIRTFVVSSGGQYTYYLNAALSVAGQTAGVNHFLTALYVPAKLNDKVTDQ